MKQRKWRLSAIAAVMMLLAAACGGSSSTGDGGGSCDAASVKPRGINASLAGYTPMKTAVNTRPPVKSARTANEGVVELRWFVGLGTGTDLEKQVPAQQQVVDDWNAANPNIQVTLEVVPNEDADDILLSQNAAGNPPDVVGPAGVRGSNVFYGNWLDLTPLIEETGYDLSVFPKAAVDAFAVGGQGQLGLPFAVFPSFMYYRPSMFEEAGLNMPPTAYGDMYTMPDGSEVEWTWDTIRNIALLLTVDSNGLNATEQNFDPGCVVQYGYHQPWNTPTEWAAWFAGGEYLSADGKTVQIPDGWLEAWTWYHDGIFKDHFIPDKETAALPEWGEGNVFGSGKIALAQSYTWYSCCVGEAVGKDWNIAPTPSYQGKVWNDLNADTFRIPAASKHPKEAFQFMSYLLGEAAPILLGVYGGMPSTDSAQDLWIADQEKTWDQGVHWDIMKQSYASSSPFSAEAYYPNYLKGRDYIENVFAPALTGTPDMDVESYVMNTFLPEFQAIVSAGE